MGIPALADAILPLPSAARNSGWSLSVCPGDRAELNSPAASLKDANLLPSGGKKNPTQLAFFNLADTSS